MPDVALDVITAAAGHWLLGENALLDRAATGGSSTKVTDSGLITFANDQSYVGGWLYFPSGSNAGQERYVSSVDLSVGDLNFVNALSGAVSSGDHYLWFRDGRWSRWLDWLNDACRNLYFDEGKYVQGITDQLWYTLPTPFSHAGWIEAIYRGPYPFRFTNQFPPPVDWYRLGEPLDIQQNIALVLEASIGADEQLYFKGRVPYAHPHVSAFTMTRSVLTPFGETGVVNPPRDVLVYAVLYRALVQKTRNATGAARTVWLNNLDLCVRQYAEKLAENGVRQVGRSVGFVERL